MSFLSFATYSPLFKLLSIFINYFNCFPCFPRMTHDLLNMGFRSYWIINLELLFVLSTDLHFLLILAFHDGIFLIQLLLCTLLKVLITLRDNVFNLLTFIDLGFSLFNLLHRFFFVNFQWNFKPCLNTSISVYTLSLRI